MPESDYTNLVRTVRQSLSQLGITTDTRILAGASGGLDSMVLLDVLRKLGHSMAVAHVNFKLRGKESDLDASWVRSWCLENGITYHELSEDAKAYANTHNCNIQSAARIIRYTWWDQLMDLYQYTCTLTAHHLDDSIETVLHHLIRGTGIKGLQGIPERRDRYLRPLLEVSREEIESYALYHSIPYREDSSNRADDYQRNRIRHHVIPAILEFAPDFHSAMKHNLLRMRLEWRAWEAAYDTWVAFHIKRETDGYRILRDVSGIAFLLRWLEDQGFPWNLSYDFLTAPHPDSGSVLAHHAKKLYRTEEGFYLSGDTPPLSVKVDRPGSYDIDGYRIHIELIDGPMPEDHKKPHTEYVNTSIMKWPVSIRSVEPGDTFQPLGMHGKSKKLQDLMVDLKLDMHEKQKVFLLANTDHIIWVMGLRLDERARVGEKDLKMYRLRLEPIQS